jgi:GNAT superfamily N-acetyltransferase
MPNLSVVIRRATSADVDELTELHCASLSEDEHIPVMLGPIYVRATYLWLTQSAIAYVLAAVAEGRIVGLVAVCDAPFTLPMFLACLPSFLRSLAARPTLLWNNALWRRLLRRPNSQIRTSTRSLEGCAEMTIGVVAAGFRGTGVFPSLVAAAKVMSRARGSTAIRAGVYSRNGPSRRVFEKGGWSLMGDLGTSDTVSYCADLR